MSTLESVFFADPIFTTILLFVLIVIFLVIYLTHKLHLITILKKDLRAMNQTIRDLDQQAKLIIKSDMELKLYQQEVEDKLSKLTLIKELIVASIHILSRDELFAQINERVINAIGFEKGLLLDFNDLDIKVNVGFETAEADRLTNAIKYKREVFKGSAVLPENSELFAQISKLLRAKDILIAPIKVREDIYAIFLVAGLILPTDIKGPEEEAFLIICMHLSHCLDKIRLFEGLYLTKDNLERKIKERTNELVKSLRAIEVISKAKSDFISSVSHELRTPLTSVKGFSSLLVEEKFGKLPEEAKNRLNRIDENVNKLMDIVNTLLDIARIESGKMEIKIAPAELIKLIKEVTDFLTPQMQAKNISLTLELPAGLWVFIDKNLIERVLINLINNALKYTPEGGTITVACQAKANQALVWVRDTGCGISQENLERIFQEFFRVNNPENIRIRGTGLGLSLVKRIIETHKEKIWVESQEGRGSTFYFTLRIAQTPGAEKSAL